MDEAKDQLARCEDRMLEKTAESKRLEDQVRSLGEALDAMKRELGQARKTRVTKEEELRSARVTLARFPVRLFVR
jgi:chromosome segregation ATPase